MSDNPILDAIAASTPDKPVLLSLRPWINGQGEAPLPPETIVSVFVVPQPAPVPIPTPVPATMTMYVISTTGVSVRSLYGTDQAKVGALPFRAAVEVEQVYTATATGYVWRKIASTSTVFPGKFVAEKTSDGATTILSVNRP